MITYGAVVPRALQAAQKLEREHGVKVELIDLRTLNPFDWETIAASVAKTNRALVAYEDIAELGIRRRDRGPHRRRTLSRISMRRCDAWRRWIRFVAYQPILEDAILPQARDLFRGMKELAEY